MTSCANCGEQMNDGEKFCIICGSKVEGLTCAQCQEPLEEKAKFCMKCGSKVAVPAAPVPVPPQPVPVPVSVPAPVATEAKMPVQPASKPWQPNQKPTSSGDLKGAGSQYMSFPEARQTVPKWKMWQTGVAMLLAVCVGTASIIGLSSLFKEKDYNTQREKNFDHNSSNNEMTQKGDYKAYQETVTEENPVITIDDITIDFGAFNISGSEEVVVTKAPVQEFEEGLRIHSYQIELGDRTEFSDVINIYLPYDPTYSENGFEAESVAGKYFN